MTSGRKPRIEKLLLNGKQAPGDQTLVSSFARINPPNELLTGNIKAAVKLTGVLIPRRGFNVSDLQAKRASRKVITPSPR
jgi:hypothetical protein